MSRIKWDKMEDRKYKLGVDHGTLYSYNKGAYGKAVPWNGLSNVSLNPSGAEQNPVWADNIKYLNITSAEELALTIECYTYPDEFESCDGKKTLVPGIKLGQQNRKMFGFSFRNKVGSAAEGDDLGFEITLIYGCLASPSEQSNTTVNDSPEPPAFSYEVSTTPVTVSGVDEDGKPFKPVASITISSLELSKENMQKLEDILYGKDGTSDEDVGTEGRLPLPDELKELFAAG